MGADIQTALITAVKCLFTVFFYVNRIRSNFWKVGYYRIRIWLDNTTKILEWSTFGRKTRAYSRGVKMFRILLVNLSNANTPE